MTWQDLGGWWPRFDQGVVQPLLAGRDARYRVRDWAGDEFGSRPGEWRTIPWAPTVVLEGVTCAWASVRPHLALAVRGEAPADQQLRRGLRRDGDSHRPLWERWKAEETAFFAVDGTRATADLVVDGADDRARLGAYAPAAAERVREQRVRVRGDAPLLVGPLAGMHCG